ncbi:hypothetical protein SRHO_G00042630 [Serrasalmus rhombeus]
MADAMVQKFSFPFTCLPCDAQPDEQPITEENHHHGNQLQEPGTQDPSDKPNQEMKTKSALKDKKENKSAIKAYLTTDKEGGALQKRGQCHSKPRPTDSALRNVFEKWASLQSEEQRPSTKRQLSAESEAKCVSVRKRSIATGGRGEPVKPLTHADPGTQPRKACLPISSSSQRKPRGQLFSSTGVFHKVDTHAVSAGKELKEQGVFSAQSIARTITQGARNELEKLRAIWVWLCHNIVSDMAAKDIKTRSTVQTRLRPTAQSPTATSSEPAVSAVVSSAHTSPDIATLKLELLASLRKDIAEIFKKELQETLGDVLSSIKSDLNLCKDTVSY